MKRLLAILLLVSVFSISNVFSETKISYNDLSYLNKEVNTGHYVSSFLLGGTMNLYAGNTFMGITLTTIKMLSYGMIAYGKMNFYGDQSASSSSSTYITTTSSQNISAPSINYTSLGVLLGGILISGIISAVDITTGLDTIEKKKEEIIKNNNIELNLNTTGNQNQISIGIKF